MMQTTRRIRLPTSYTVTATEVMKRQTDGERVVDSIFVESLRPAFERLIEVIHEKVGDRYASATRDIARGG
jgi:hypothetical protein